MLADIDSDMVRLIASEGAGIALAMGTVCAAWRKAVQAGEGHAFHVRDLLSSLGPTSLQCDIERALLLSRRTASPHPPSSRKRRHGGGFYKIYDHDRVVSIFRAHGGMATLERRLARRERGRTK